MNPKLVCLALLLLSLACAQDSLSLTEMERNAKGAFILWQNEHQTFASGEVLQAILQQTMKFQGLYCHPANSTDIKDKCKRVLRGTNDYRLAVAAYLNGYTGRPMAVETLFSLLATAIGSSSDTTGWPSSESPQFAIFTLDVPQINSGAVEVDLVQFQAPSIIRRVMIAPGRHTVSFIRSGETNQSFNVEWPVGGIPRYFKISPSVSGRRPSRVDPDPNVYCADWTDLSSDPMLAPSFAIRGEPLRPFDVLDILKSSTLRIGVIDDSGLCDAECQLALASFVLDALAVWRTSCEECHAWLFTGVSIADNIFLETNLQNTLVQAIDSRNFTSLRPRADGKWTTIGESNHLSKRVVGSSYTLIPKHFMRSGDCEAAELPSFLKELLCQGETCPHCANLSIVLRKAGTACGNDSDIIACANPGLNIELNVRDFAFAALRPGAYGEREEGRRFKVGTNRDVVNLEYIMVHEVGHYFGIPHVKVDTPNAEGRFNVLAAGYRGQSFCVSNSLIGMANRAARTDWQYRLKVQEGIRDMRDKDAKK